MATTVVARRAGVLAHQPGDVPDDDEGERPATGDVVGRRGEVEQQAGEEAERWRRTAGPRTSAAATTTSRQKLGTMPSHARWGNSATWSTSATTTSAARRRAPEGPHRRLPSASMTPRSLGVPTAPRCRPGRGRRSRRTAGSPRAARTRGGWRRRRSPGRPGRRRRTARRPGCPRSRWCRPWSGAALWSTSSRSRLPWSPRPPWPRRKPTFMLVPTRPPTTDSVSTISSTVAVVGVTRSTRPTRPSSFSTVWSGRTPASEPASTVTVRENDCAGP